VSTPKYEYDQRGKLLIQATHNPIAGKRVNAKKPSRDFQYHPGYPGNRLALKNIKGTHIIGMAAANACRHVPGSFSNGADPV